MHSGARAFAAVFLAGAVALIALGLGRGSSLAYSIGVAPASPAAVLAAGARVCQGPIELPADTTFDRVRFTLGTYSRPGPAVRVHVLAAESDRRLATGLLNSGYPDVDQAPEHVVRVGEVAPGGPITICLRNSGRRKVAVFGQAGVASSRTAATLGGQPIENDIGLALLTGKESIVGLLPELAERAARFRAGWLTPAVYAGLGLLLVVGTPLLLARGIARAEEEAPEA